MRLLLKSKKSILTQFTSKAESALFGQVNGYKVYIVNPYSRTTFKKKFRSVT